MKKHYRNENDCLNCGTVLEGKYCHNCGQENLQIKESFGHMMNHAISDYFHFDHQFFHTLKPLLFKPGFLTNEYMAGRRVQYLHPVKMYIFISIVYFLLLFQSGHETVNVTPEKGKPVNAEKVIDSVNREIAKDPNISSNRKKAIQENVKKYGTYGAKIATGKNDSAFFNTGDTTYKQYLAKQQKLPESERDGLFIRTINKKMLTYKEKYGSRAKDVFWAELEHNTPKMMFLLLPIFALILSVTFWKSKKFYVEHLIYAFHLHCFLFLFLAIVMLLEIIVPGSWKLTGWINFLTTIYIIWYIYRSLRVVYHRNKFRTITKMIGISFIYFFMASMCMGLLVVITALTAT